MSCCLSAPSHWLIQCWLPIINTLRQRQNGLHFADDIFQHIFLHENVWISLKISQNFVPKVSTNNIPALVQIMAWRRPGDKPLSQPIMVGLLTHICVIRPQWVNVVLWYQAERNFAAIAQVLSCKMSSKTILLKLLPRLPGANKLSIALWNSCYNSLWQLFSSPSEVVLHVFLARQNCHYMRYNVYTLYTSHDDVIKWKHFPRYWPFVRGIHRSPVNFPHKGQWRGALMLSVIYAWINGWVNTGEAGDLRRHHAHCDVIVMYFDGKEPLVKSCINLNRGPSPYIDVLLPVSAFPLSRQHCLTTLLPLKGVPMPGKTIFILQEKKVMDPIHDSWRFNQWQK